MTNWYVVNTHARSENAALEHLRRQGFTAYLPCYRKRRRHARKTDIVAAPLFPGYLFVCMDIARTRWRAIRSTIGIKSLICQGDHPIPLPEGVIDDIQAREDTSGIVSVCPTVDFEPGQSVKIMDGPLREQVGWFEAVTDDERVVILLELLGRKMRMTLPGDAISAYA